MRFWAECRVFFFFFFRVFVSDWRIGARVGNNAAAAAAAASGSLAESRDGRTNEGRNEILWRRDVYRLQLAGTPLYAFNRADACTQI